MAKSVYLLRVIEHFDEGDVGDFRRRFFRVLNFSQRPAKLFDKEAEYFLSRQQQSRSPLSERVAGRRSQARFWNLLFTQQKKSDGRVAIAVELLLDTHKGLGAASSSYRVK